MQIVVLPQVIEQKLKVEERQEVIGFINELITDTSDVLKKDIIEILEERFEKKLSVELVNLKLELIERIAKTENQLNERIAGTENQLNERIAGTENLLNERIARTENLLNEKIGLLSARLSQTEAHLIERISTTNEKLKTELVEKIANSKVEMIKWMFIFWLGSVITIIGGITGILKITGVF